MLRTGLLNFSKGVLAPQLLGRVDVAAYNAGLKRGENISLLKQGGFSIRPGWRFVSEAQGPEERLFSFQFSDEQPYAIAFGQAYIQPLTAGGVVLEEELVITGATASNPMILTAAFHRFQSGDRVFLRGIAGALGALLNERIWSVVSIPSDSTFGIGFNGEGSPPFTGATGGVTRQAPLPPPPAPPDVPPPYVPPAPPPVWNGGGAGYRDAGSDGPFENQQAL